MANVTGLRKGLDINLEGKAVETYTAMKKPGPCTLMPDGLPEMTPKVIVKGQEYVMADGPLLIDKYRSKVKFVPPVSDVMTSVGHGVRHKVLDIVMEAVAEQSYEDSGKKSVTSMGAETMKATLSEAGLFTSIRQRPYDIITDLTVTPREIFISAFGTNPLTPNFEFALKDEETNFQTGLDVPVRLAGAYLGISVKQSATALTQVRNITITAFDRSNPTGNVGVQTNHLGPISKGEAVWIIDLQAVIFISCLLNTGHVNLTRVVAMTGSGMLKLAYYRPQVDALLANAFVDSVTKDKDSRYISSDVLTGKQVPPSRLLGAFHSQLTVTSKGGDIHETLGWAMSRFNQFSANHSYFSWLMDREGYTLGTRVEGDERHTIMSGEYNRVFPIDVLPEYLIKTIIAGDIDHVETLGIYEVAPEDFALCEFICSSKMELQRIICAGLSMFRSEIVQEN